MEFKDYYKILGVDEKVDAADLKKAYRKLARKYHPDVSDEADCEARFKEVNEAYEVLKDPEKRAEYDYLKSAGAVNQEGQFRPPPDWESAAHFSRGGFTNTGGGGFSEFFDTIFGHAAAGQGHHGDSFRGQFRARGEDLHVKVPLFLEEVHAGCEKTIEYQMPVINKQGYLSYERKKFRVKVPARSSPSKPIRLKGQGAPGAGGAESGDLFLDIELAPHPIYSVKGNNLYRKLSIAPWEATLGASVKIDTLSGEVQLTVPPNSQSGQQLRLKGRGLNEGDLYVELDIVMPKVSTDRMKELYRELAKESNFNPREESA